jgi:hypothetical protein
MRIYAHRGTSGNDTRRILCRTLVPVAAFLLMLSANSIPVQGGEEKPKRDLIDRQIYSDMMYGADDYFGESTDLAYADGTFPTVIQPVTPTTPTSPTQPSTPAPAPAPTPVVVVPVQPSGGGGA